MSWTTAISDLRTLVSDGALDKYNFRKEIFGILDSSNKSFKTLEVRRITDFTNTQAPLGIFVNNALVTVTADFPVTGELTLASAPSNGDKIEASYYSQWFLDSELTVFLTSAANWLVGFDDFTAIDSGLRPATLHYAAAECYAKLSLRFTRARSDEYRVEDAVDKGRAEMVKSYNDMSTAERTLAETLRSQFYTRNDQYKQPIFASLVGRVPTVQPKR